MTESEIFVTGAAGMVGSRFVELLPKHHNALTPPINELDLTNTLALESFFKREKPDAIVHFAAFTDVGAAEKERGDKNGICWKINVEGTKNLAEAAKRHGAFMVHISTDYVFPGSKNNPGPYKENRSIGETEGELTWYGFTKAEAEREIDNILGDNAAILRIIYPVRAKFDQKLDYIRKPLSLYDQGKLYPLFTDQQISVSYIDEICSAITKIVDRKVCGIFHASTPDLTTPYELISYTLKKARGAVNVVKPSSLDKFLETVDNPVRYPKFGGLKVEQTERVLRMRFSGWRELIDKVVSQLNS